VTETQFYRVGRVLGKGAFGKVNLAINRLTNKFVALKKSVRLITVVGLAVQTRSSDGHQLCRRRSGEYGSQPSRNGRNARDCCTIG
jgi:hypothetical protein